MDMLIEDETWGTLGVDTHRDIHVVAALDALGRTLGFLEISADTRGFKTMVGWASQLGIIDQVGIEGCGSYGAGLSRRLRSQGLAVVEIDRPDRQLRRRKHRPAKSRQPLGPATLGLILKSGAAGASSPG